MSSGDERRSSVGAAVALVALVALAARLVALDARPFHWDEARVGYWTLRYAETGRWSYRPVAGGPLLYHAGAVVTGLLGASDTAARLPVALAGGLLPLAALLFRSRLDGLETALLALVLAANPLLLYFSRFLRGDVVAAGLALVVLGSLVRAAAGDARFAPVAGLTAAAALAASGFAVAYPLLALVAGGVVVDHERVVGRPAAATERLDALLGRLRGSPRTAATGLGTFLGAVVVLFAPRPLGLDAVAGAVVDAPQAFVGVRVVDRSPEGAHEILPYLAETAAVVGRAALPVALLAGLALARLRYGGVDRRPVVEFAAYWGLAGLFVFPTVAESLGPWIAVHSVVFLAVPAAVGGASAVRFGRRAVDRGATREALGVAVLLVALVAQTGVVAATETYAAPDPDDALTTYGQAADDLEPVHEAAAETGGPVLLYGDEFVVRPESRADAPPVPDRFGERLPVAWYLARAGVDVRSATGAAAVADPPPVVVATGSTRTIAAARLDGYEARSYRTALWNRRIVVFVRR
jgi:uncharacterized protein (TIGR03663 family)